MTVKKILTEPNKILREKSLLVEKFDEDLQKLMDDMLETMYAAPGIGLAAIQVGIPKKVIVLDIAQKEGQKKPIFIINPKMKLLQQETPTSKEILFFSLHNDTCMS